MHSIFAGILLLAALASAKVCESPKQLKFAYKLFSYEIKSGKTDGSGGVMSYDGIKRRRRMDFTYNGGKYAIIQLYDKGEQYYISNEGKCFSIGPPKDKFERIEIPSNATEVARGRIGTASNGLDIIRVHGFKDGAPYLATVTKDECVITSSMTLIRNEHGTRTFYYMSFTGVSVQNVDEDFELPHDCHKTRRRRSPPGTIPWPLNNPGNYGW